MAAPASPGEDMDVEVATFLASCAASEYGAAEALLDRLDAPPPVQPHDASSEPCAAASRIPPPDRTASAALSTSASSPTTRAYNNKVSTLIIAEHEGGLVKPSSLSALAAAEAIAKVNKTMDLLRQYSDFSNRSSSLEQALMLGCVGADVTASSRKSSWVNLTSQDTEWPDLANARVVVTRGRVDNEPVKARPRVKSIPVLHFLFLVQWVRPELPSMQDMCRMNFKSEPHGMSDVGLEHDAYHAEEMTPEQLITEEKLSTQYAGINLVCMIEVILGTTGRKQGTSSKAASLPSTESLLCKIRLAEAFISLEHPLSTKFCHEKIAYRAIMDMAYPGRLNLFIMQINMESKGKEVVPPKEQEKGKDVAPSSVATPVQGWIAFAVVHQIKICFMVTFKPLTPNMLKVIMFNDHGIEVVTRCGKQHDAFTISP
ncbi:tRNA-specific adenosine deaminase 1 [Hordeum vulgare]|nr:tRNA-specific adenosine deaminase 1 [Hordeum vulgare]